MERFFLIMTCAGVVLLTTAIGLASPRSDGVSHSHERALLLRTIPR